jgi:hypothetical protein
MEDIMRRRHPLCTASYADAYQLCGVLAVAETGGPRIPFRMGRPDVPSQRDVSQEFLLPNPFNGTAQHLREVGRF